MFFSKKTQLNKILPKAKFMKLAELSTPIRAEIQNNVERIILANILRQETINISAGENVKEIDLFEFLLKEKQISNNLIKEIDSAIPKHIVFVFRFKDLVQLAVSYKEKTSVENRYKVVKTYRSEWQKVENANLELSGLDLDSVFTNFINQIANGKIETDGSKDIKQAVEDSLAKEKLERKITQIKSKIRKECQFNKQLELKKELKELERKLETSKFVS